MNFKLHLAKLILTGDIPCLEFDTKYKLLDYVNDFYKQYCDSTYTLDKICLVAVDEQLIVTNDIFTILNFIYNQLGHFAYDNNVIIHEYNSYEEAYKAAILLKEESKLCYSDSVYLDLYPVYFNGQQYQQDQCAELFVSVYTDRCQLNEAGGIYLGDGCSVYPDGSID
jgi:hypothetical protein